MNFVKLLNEYEISPVIDKENKFFFFQNPKVCTISITWTLLKERTVTHVDSNYLEELSKLTTDDFKNRFKFSIVRNPWDKVVSSFSYLQKQKDRWIHPKENFENFLKNELIYLMDNIHQKWIQKQSVSKRQEILCFHFNKQHFRTHYDDECFLDFLGRYENLKKDWEFISEKIGCSSILPHKNKTNHVDYKKFYNEETKDIVSKLYAKDIQLYGYKFEG
jgi:hypothetical protein